VVDGGGGVTGMIRATAKREVEGMGDRKERLRVRPKVSKEPEEPKSSQSSQSRQS
jgi:hypothetical protein